MFTLQKARKHWKPKLKTRGRQSKRWAMGRPASVGPWSEQGIVFHEELRLFSVAFIWGRPKWLREGRRGLGVVNIPARGFALHQSAIFGLCRPWSCHQPNIVFFPPTFLSHLPPPHHPPLLVKAPAWKVVLPSYLQDFLQLHQ